MLQQLQVMGLHLRYADPAACAADDWHAASALISHAAPELRLAAVQLLSALANAAAPLEQPSAGARDRDATAAEGDSGLAAAAGSPALAAPALPAAQQARVDAAFLSLCSAVSTDTVAAIRLEALLGLAGMHHASRAVQQQALSKRAMLRKPGMAGAAGQPAATEAAAAAAVADNTLLDSATGAFVHGVEDDVVQVRIAAVSAMLSLGSQDAQLADEVAELLAELAADELLPVRLAALKGLVTWAGQHRQRRQAAKQCQQQQQQQGHVQQLEVDQAPADQQQQQQQRAHEAAEAEDVDAEDDEEGLLAEGTDLPQHDAVDLQKQSGNQQQGQQQQHFDHQGTPLAAAGAAACHGVSGKLANSTASSAAPAAARQTYKPSKKRKGDLPPWGTDGVAAGIAALRDSHAQVRTLALQLLALLPPASMQAIVSLLQALISCCEQHQQQHWQAALAVVHQLAQQRTAMVAKSCQNICKLLARAVRGPEGGASVDASAAAEAQLHQEQGLIGAAAAAAASKAAAHSPVAIELLSELLLATARLKASMLPALQQQVEKQGLTEAASLQLLLVQLDEMRQLRMVALQQQQQL